MLDLVLWPGIEPRPPVLVVWSLSHWGSPQALFFFKLPFLLNTKLTYEQIEAEAGQQLKAAWIFG